MGNPESKQFDKYKKLPPDHKLTQKSQHEEVNLENYPDGPRDDGTSVDTYSTTQIHSELSTLSGLPGEVVPGFSQKDDKKPLLLNMADTPMEDIESVEPQKYSEPSPKIQGEDTLLSQKDSKDIEHQTDQKDRAEIIIRQGLDVYQGDTSVIVGDREITEIKDPPLIDLDRESENIHSNDSYCERKDVPLIDLCCDSQDDPLIDLNNKTPKQCSKDLNRDEKLIDFNLHEENFGSKLNLHKENVGSKLNKGNNQLMNERSDETNSLTEYGYHEDLDEQFVFSGELVIEDSTRRGSTADTASINSTNSSNSSYSTSSSTSSRIRDKFSVKRLFRPFRRKKDDKSDNNSTNKGTGDSAILKCSTTHSENIRTKTASIHSSDILIDQHISEIVVKEQMENTVFGHDLPIESKGGFKQKLTWRTNDNRMHLQRNGNLEDRKQSYGIYSNVIFLPDKLKGASPKRQGPKRLGTIMPIVSDDDSDSDSHSMSSKIDVLSFANFIETDIRISQNLKDEKLTKEPPEIHPSPRPVIFEDELEFIDDHFGLYTGCIAAGISKDMFTEDVYESGPCCSSVDQKECQAENKAKGSNCPIQASAKECKGAVSQNLTRHSEDRKLASDNKSSKENGSSMNDEINSFSECGLPEVLYEQFENSEESVIKAGTRRDSRAEIADLKHDVDSKAGDISLKNQKPHHFVPKEIRKPFKDGFMTDEAVNLTNTSERNQRTICQTISPPTFRKNCKFDINWNILRSQQGHFARNIKSSATNIAEDNRICLEFCLPSYEGRLDNCRGNIPKHFFEKNDTHFSDNVPKSASTSSHIELIVNEFDENGADDNDDDDDDDDDELGSETSQTKLPDANDSSDKSCVVNLQMKEYGGYANDLNSEMFTDNISTIGLENSGARETETPGVFFFEEDAAICDFVDDENNPKILEIDSSQDMSFSKPIVPSSNQQHTCTSLDISNNNVISRCMSSPTEFFLPETNKDEICLKVLDRVNTDSDVSVIRPEDKICENTEGSFYPEVSVVPSVSSAQANSGTIVPFKIFKTLYEHDNRIATDPNIDDALIRDKSEIERQRKLRCSNKISEIKKVIKDSVSCHFENGNNLAHKIVDDILTDKETEVQSDEEDNRVGRDIKRIEDTMHIELIYDVTQPNVNNAQADTDKTSKQVYMELNHSPDISQQENLVSSNLNCKVNSVDEAKANQPGDVSETVMEIIETDMNPNMNSFQKSSVSISEGLDDESGDKLNNSTVSKQIIYEDKANESAYDDHPVKGCVNQFVDCELKQTPVNLDAIAGNKNVNSIGENNDGYTDTQMVRLTEIKTKENMENAYENVEGDFSFELDNNNLAENNPKTKETDVPPEIIIEEDREDGHKSYTSVYRSKNTKETEDNRLVQIDYEEYVVTEITEEERRSDSQPLQNETEKANKDNSSDAEGFGSFLKPLCGMVEQILPDELKQHMHGFKIEDMISDIDFQAIDITLPPHEFQKRLEEQQKKFTEKLMKKFSESKDESGSQSLHGPNQTEQKTEDSKKKDKGNGKSKSEDNNSDSDSSADVPKSDDNDDEDIEPLAQLDDANWDAVVRLETIKCRQATESPLKLRCTVICVDISGSMIGEPWKQMRGVLETFVKGIEDIRAKYGTTELVSMVTFGHETKVALTPSTDYSQILTTFDKLEVRGNTPLEPVFLLALFPVLVSSNNRYDFNLHGRVVRHRVILLTDGHPTPHQMLSENDFVTDRQAKKAVASVVKKMKFLNCRNLRNIMNIHCVPIGNSPNMELLEIIAKKSGGQIVPCTDIHRLSTNTHNYLTSLQITRHLLDSDSQTLDKKVLKSIINTLHPEISADSMNKGLAAVMWRKVCITKDQMICEIENEFEKDRKQKKKEKKKNFSGVNTDDENDSDADSDESSNSNGLENDSLTEVEGMPKIGTRVKRGPDFDTNEIVVVSETGTITGHSVRDKKCLFVMWDCGVKTYCRYGEKDCYDVMLDDSQHVPCKLEDRVRIGHRVRRGPDWQYGNQDGGSDQLGTVYNVLDSGVEIQVRWDNGNFGRYRYNYDGTYDVLLSPPDDPFDVIRHTHEMNRRNFAKIRGIDINSVVGYRHERLDLDLNESLFGLDLEESTKGQGDKRMNKNAFVQHRKTSIDCFNT